MDGNGKWEMGDIRSKVIGERNRDHSKRRDSWDDAKTALSLYTPSDCVSTVWISYRQWEMRQRSGGWWRVSVPSHEEESEEFGSVQIRFLILSMSFQSVSSPAPKSYGFNTCY